MIKETKNGDTREQRKGEAYAIFNCDAPKSQIEDYIRGRLPPDDGSLIVEALPHELGLEMKLQELGELIATPGIDPELLRTIEQEAIYTSYPSTYKGERTDKLTPLKDLRYAITARNNVSNKDVCEKLTSVMNNVYLKFNRGKPAQAVVMSKDEGRYRFWENDERVVYHPQN